MKKYRKQTNYKVEISNGELLDKISILELKKLKIEDKDKLVNIEKEFDTLNPLVVDLFEGFGSQLQNLYLELAKINGQLWDIEDWIRDCEREKRFDAEFIQLARSVYVTNDERSRVKNEINKLTKSGLVEEKSYKDYK
tara:strand:- start:34 stop:447 length:414 start_codon:yes stop_codon:yes gene_type:complete